MRVLVIDTASEETAPRLVVFELNLKGALLIVFQGQCLRVELFLLSLVLADQLESVDLALGVLLIASFSQLEILR